MPLPPNYLPRKGDLLSVIAEVKHDFDEGDEVIYAKIRGADVVLLPDQVDLHQQVIHIGEFVSPRSPSVPQWTGQVLALHDCWAWVKAYGDLATYSIDKLRVVPPPRPEQPGESAAPLPELRSDGTEDDQGEVY